MAFDGIITRAAVREIGSAILDGKVDKIYQPAPEDIVFYVHKGGSRKRLFATSRSQAASLRFIKDNPGNPESPYPFCMLLRKHLQGSRIISVSQKDSDRIIEIAFERMNELGLMVNKRIVFEIMGKHSNIILVDTLNDQKILGSIKGIPSGINRVREVLPGRVYQYPPSQDKIPFITAGEEDLGSCENGKEILSRIGGISPAVADELAHYPGGRSRKARLDEILSSIDDLSFEPVVYSSEDGTPKEYHITRLSDYEAGCRKTVFDSLSDAMDYFYEHRESTNILTEKKNELKRPVKNALDKNYLKKQRLSEDILRAEKADRYKRFGDILTASISKLDTGLDEVELTDFYTGEPVLIPLDPLLSPSANAQAYYKKYNKSKTAIVEKNEQLEETNDSIAYLGSVLTFIDNTGSLNELETLKAELIETGYIKDDSKTKRQKKFKAAPKEYMTSDGYKVLVGRNNRENDVLTLEIASKGDMWLHTKDIPGSHVIIRSDGKTISDEAILEAASIAAFNSKARNSANVPVDYVPIRYVKKPNGAKPGMVIFTHNRTVFADPKLPDSRSD